jgi:hypothetical protein
MILRTPTDIFPNINIPVVAWQYTGMNPEELEGRLTSTRVAGSWGSTDRNFRPRINSPGRISAGVYLYCFTVSVNCPACVGALAAEAVTVTR